ncbi:MAG: succinate dehydrogenase, cytochrome b556 subunit [Pseudomonadota bacterium]
MASASGRNRPLSPHLTVYRPQITSMLSVLHRGTGVAMAFSLALVVWWLLAAATGSEYFEFVDGLLTSVIGFLILLGSAFAFFYHMCNGLRHMWWDMGFGYEMDQVTQSGYVVLGASGVLTLILLIVAL